MYVHLMPATPAAAERDVPFAGASNGVSAYLTRIPVRSVNRIVIVPVAGVIRLEAEDNYVRIWADRPYLHKQTLSGLRDTDYAEASTRLSLQMTAIEAAQKTMLRVQSMSLFDKL